MDGVYILDENFENARYLDVFESLIWTTRYKEAGEFELYTPVTEDLFNDLIIGRYLYTNEFYDKDTNTAHLMIIESIELDDQHVKVTGKSLKSILDRRIVWGKLTIEKNTTVHDAIKKLVVESLITPVEPKDTENPYTHIPIDYSAQRAARVISNFRFDDVAGDWESTTEEISYDNQGLLDAVNDLCTKFKVGYEVVLDFDDKCFHMHLIKPVDHSWDQTDAPAVIFSPEFDNLKKSNYIESIEKYKNVVYIRGEQYSDDEINKFTQHAILGDSEGLKRRELYIDQSSLSHTEDDGTIYADYETYQNMLLEKAKSELEKEEHSYTKVYDGEADTEAMTDYVFGVDYKIGDTVELVTRYGESAEVRVTEMVLSVSTSGITLIPTFKAIRYEAEEANE